SSVRSRITSTWTQGPQSTIRTLLQISDNSRKKWPTGRGRSSRLTRNTRITVLRRLLPTNYAAATEAAPCTSVPAVAPPGNARVVGPMTVPGVPGSPCPPGGGQPGRAAGQRGRDGPVPATAAGELPDPRRAGHVPGVPPGREHAQHPVELRGPQPSPATGGGGPDAGRAQREQP